MSTSTKRMRLQAFTIVELLVAMLISGMLIGVTTATYSLYRKSITQDQMRADITQNARVAMDRLSRELRQSKDVVTVMPVNPQDVTVIQPHEVEFMDGHISTPDPDVLTYRRYYVQNGMLKMDLKEYYLAADPTTRVEWGTPGLLQQHVISTVDIASNVQGLDVYNDNDTLQILLTTSDQANQSYVLRTYVMRRN